MWAPALASFLSTITSSKDRDRGHLILPSETMSVAGYDSATHTHMHTVKEKEEGDETGRQSWQVVLFRKEGLGTIVTDQPNPVTKAQNETLSGAQGKME